MKSFFTLLQQQFLQNRLLLLVHLALGILFVVTSFIAAHTSLDLIYPSLVSIIWAIWMLVAIVLFVVREPALGENALWRTRPISPLTLALSKTAYLILVFNLIPALITISFLVLKGLVGSDLVPFFFSYLIIGTITTFAIAIPTTLAKNFLGAVLAIIVCAISALALGGLLTTSLLLPDDLIYRGLDINNVSSYGTGLSLLATLLGIAVFLVPYLTRSFLKTLAACVFATGLITVAANLYRPEGTTPSHYGDNFATNFNVAPGTYSYEDSDSDQDSASLTFTLEGVPPNDLALIPTCIHAEVLAGGEHWPATEDTYNIADWWLRLGVGGDSAIKSTLGVDTLHYRDDLYLTTAEAVINNHIFSNFWKFGSEEKPEKMHLVGTGQAGLYRYEVVAKFPTIQESVGTTTQWDRSTAVRLSSLGSTSKDQLVAEMRFLRSISDTLIGGADLGLFHWASTAYTYALVIPDSSTAHLATSIDYIDSDMSFFEDIKITFDLPKFPAGSSIVILQQKLEQATPFDFDLKIPKNE